MLNESFLLKERKDRMGSHFWQYLGVFLLSKKENKKITIQRPIEKYNYMHDLWFWDIRDNFDVIKPEICLLIAHPAKLDSEVTTTKQSNIDFKFGVVLLSC